jgi:hypothetical protein
MVASRSRWPSMRVMRRYPVDLQMRKNPRTGAEHATLYVGLTSVLQVTRIKGDLLRLHGHKHLAGKHHAFDPAWSHPMTAKELTPRWRAVEGYLEDVIPLASAKPANKEGAAADQPEVIIRDMLDQRTRLGLASPNRAALPDEPEVVPVVAIQRDSGEVFLDRLRSVHRTILDSPGCAGTNLEVYEVSMTGRLQPLAL